MKVFRALFVSWVSCLMLFTSGYSQFEQYECGTIVDPEEYAMDLDQFGGQYLTADGVVRALIVFVQYKNDTASHNYWTAGEPPDYMDEFIDPDEGTNSTYYHNITHYFDEMSFGEYQFVGDTIHVIAPHTKAWYDSAGYGRAATNKDVLQNAVDPLVDFSDYDNWERKADYRHENNPDGIVDMIIMVWRGFQFGLLGEASLGYGSGITLDGVEIRVGYPDGSGVFCSYPGDTGPGKLLQTMAHEVGHWIVGGPHPYPYSNAKYNVWSVLGTQFACGINMNAFERERLAWINITEIDTSINAPLADYITTGVAYKYHPPNGAANEWYYFENHQKLSIYDDATIDGNDKGVWIIHQQGPYNGSANIRIKPTDGFWDWENPYNSTECFSQSLPAFRKLNPNSSQSGLTNRDKLPTYASRTAAHFQCAAMPVPFTSNIEDPLWRKRMSHEICTFAIYLFPFNFFLLRAQHHPLYPNPAAANPERRIRSRD